jgi:hypothetical protein
VCRHHVIRQRLAQAGFKVLLIYIYIIYIYIDFSTSDNVGAQIFVSGFVFPGDNGGGVYAWLFQQTAFYFSGLYTVTADFDLVVYAAQVFNVPVGQPSRQVACAVHLACPEGVMDEFCGCQSGLIQVASR